MLRRMGAEVVKVEGPAGGDVVRYMSPRVGPTSAMFEALNGGKRGVVIDLKHGDGPGVLKRMAAQADVVVEGFRPGVMDRLGVGYESLRAANEALVYCSKTALTPTRPATISTTWPWPACWDKRAPPSKAWPVPCPCRSPTSRAAP